MNGPEVLYRRAGRPAHDVSMLTLASRNHLTWMRARNLARSTIASRRTALEALGDRCDPIEATAADIEAVVSARNLQPATRNVWVSHLSAYYRWMMDEGLVEKNPMSRVPRARVPESLPRPIGEIDLERALAAANARMAAWLTLGGYAGLRVSEIAHLHGEHVSAGTLRVVRSKGGKSRVIPMHPKVETALEPFLRTGELWTLAPADIGKRIARHFRSHDIDATAHALRHRFATAVYEATGDILVVRDLLGHASTATTQIYARVSVERRRAAVAMI